MPIIRVEIKSKINYLSEKETLSGMKRILPIIVLSQFFCTSLWFAGNAVMVDIIKNLGLSQGFLANLTSAVQLGFISGTLLFAIFAVSDRFSPSRIFFTCAIIAALLNLGICIEGISVEGILGFRFFTGFFLAGIYPVGMKIASDYYQKGLGRSLGFLVGALVLGTAFPHLLKSLSANLDWKYVIFSISILAAMGGLSMLIFVPDGPFRKQGQKLQLTTFIKGFRNQHFRAAAFGYFGHMWELYTFWAFVPIMLLSYQDYFHVPVNIPLLSFLIIASGSVSCVLGGLLAQSFGVKRIATLALFLSCICCLVSPLFLYSGSFPILVGFLFFWGWVVIADSPLFSTLVAQNVPEESRGTSLTIVNCIGFSITIISIQCTKLLSENMHTKYLYLVLALGPILGLVALLKDNRSTT